MAKRDLLCCQSGASAAEFTLVLPLLLILLFAIIDGGRFAWEYNRATKATQVGARVAIVTDSVPSGLKAESYVGKTVGGVTLTQGDVIRPEFLGEITCTRTECTCTTAPCPAAIGTLNTTVFDQVLLPRMRAIKPDITAANIRLHYFGSGVGYAGDPNGMDIQPLVSVQLTGLQFQPITSFLLATLPMPSFATSLTAEDSAGTTSN